MIRSLLSLLICSAVSLAGGGPETTLVIVNGRSPSSRRIANEYRALRGIPANHLVILETVPHDGVVPLATFRTAIWEPIARFMKSAGLEGQIDLIAYSADFPYAVDFKKALGDETASRQVGRHASLTGVTYLIRQVEADEPFWEIMRGSNARETNRYCRLGFSGGRRLTGAERNLAMRAQGLQKAGKLEDARKAYEQFLQGAPDFGRIWVAYAGCLVRLRQRDAAFGALDQAAARGFDQVGIVEGQPALAPLRKDPRWAPTLERIRSAIRGLRPTLGFRASQAWNGSGEPVDDASTPHRYFLAVQLAYTGFRGSSVPAVLRYLRASVGADATNPDGTVYVCMNGDVRSTARQQFFAPLQAALKARGRKVELLDKTKIPLKKSDVIGAVVGTASFDWGKSGSTILPGAICEHLTSFGAHFRTPGQTKLTEFLRFGAAGASGTVAEPLALHLKFPNPLIHAFYSDGCNLAESFYQSVYGPYQLMVAGDGLCQPFAKPPAFELKVPEQPWNGSVEFNPHGDANFEYWLDGRRVGRGESYTLDAAAGWRDFRVVAVAKNRIATRAQRRFERDVVQKKDVVEYGRPIQLDVKAAGQLEVFYGSRLVATKPSVPSQLVGPGPVRLIVRAGGRERAFDVRVVLEEAVDGAPEGEAALGLTGTIDDHEPVIVTALAPNRLGVRLRDQLAGHKGVKKLALAGALHVPHEGEYQLNVKGDGHVMVRLGGEMIVNADIDRQVYGVRRLGAGWHELEIEYRPRGLPDLEVMVAGGQSAAPPRLGRVLPPVAPPKWTAAKKGGYEVEWKKTPKRKIGALGLLPAKDVELTREWTVEWRRSKSSKWKPVKELKVLLAPAAVRPAKGKKSLPQAAELTFAPVKARYFRVVPKKPTRIRAVLCSTPRRSGNS